MPCRADREIQERAVKYVRRASMHVERWQFTLLGRLHAELEGVLVLAPEELVVVSGYIGPASWYVFTTRRVVSRRSAQVEALPVESLVVVEFGNFKGVGQAGPGSSAREVATLKNASTGQELRIEYETLYASMAPIYACKFWERRSRQAAAERRAQQSRVPSDC